jgi:hypothetical protein
MRSPGCLRDSEACSKRSEYIPKHAQCSDFYCIIRPIHLLIDAGGLLGIGCCPSM